MLRVILRVAHVMVKIQASVRQGVIVRKSDVMSMFSIVRRDGGASCPAETSHPAFLFRYLPDCLILIGTTVQSLD